MGFFDSVDNFFSSAYDKLQNVVTTVYHDLKDGTVRVYDDVSHDVNKIVDTGSDVVNRTSQTTATIASGAVKDVKIGLDDTKEAITNVASSGQKAIGNVAQALPQTTANLEWPLIIGGAAALIFMLKK